jgi:DNA-3-methyladenine glycosylase II
MRIKGVGPWSANIYLLMALRRPDVWPSGDIALLQALQELKALPRRPTDEEALALAEAWRPWRAAGARLLWHWYLSTPRRRSNCNFDEGANGLSAAHPIASAATERLE